MESGVESAPLHKPEEQMKLVGLNDPVAPAGKPQTTDIVIVEAVS
jgi:hypothetical protein